MIVGTVKETYPGERRVALVPSVVQALVKAGMTVHVEAGAGAAAGLTDAAYQEAGAETVASREDVFGQARIVCQVRVPSANPAAGDADLALLGSGAMLVGHADPLSDVAAIQRMADTGATCFAMELMPRITRAQTMDVLSSQATIAGYKAVVLAAGTLPKIFPMLMTAAGTISPAKVLVVGAGVAGLQAISAARRLGGVVTAYDIRPAVKEQVQSLGAKFLEIEVEADASEDKGGYAKAMDDEFYRRQAEMMTKTVAESDVIITTAAVPGKKSPVLVTAEMVRQMAPGSVIVDLAAERGGNCELTRADETVDAYGVTILGPTNLPATVPFHASQMYARNLVAFLKHVTTDGEFTPPADDEIVDQTKLTEGGAIVHRRVCEIFGLDAPAQACAGDG